MNMQTGFFALWAALAGAGIPVMAALSGSLPAGFWVAAAILPVASNSAAAEALSPQQQLAFDIYKELVEINTVTATGEGVIFVATVG